MLKSFAQSVTMRERGKSQSYAIIWLIALSSSNPIVPHSVSYALSELWAGKVYHPLSSPFWWELEVLLNFSIGQGGGSFVAMLYLFVKFLYVCNIFVQFYLLNTFLGSDYHFWGFQVGSCLAEDLCETLVFLPSLHFKSDVQFQTFLDLMSGREWLESGVFPRVTLCDFKVDTIKS